MSEIAEVTCPTCGKGLPATARFCPADGTPIRPNQTMSGRLIGGKYQITKKLGAGGMGQVYLATHIQMRRPCAIKLIQPVLEWDPEAIARFRREAENASKINHPNVAQIYDFGEDNEITYLTMEYVEGEPLSAVLKREGTIAARRTARIVWQVANALTAAHEMELVHRDLKPENIMLTKVRTWSDFVKVVDFGIAKIVGQDGQQVTGTGAFIGTPDWMSPEQFTTTTPDPRSDIYALGLIAIRCLAGRNVPVTGPTIVIPPKDLGNPAGLNGMAEAAKWPEPVRASLRRAIAWDAKQRYQTPEQFAKEFARAVSEWVPAEPGVSEPWEGRLGGATAATVPMGAPGSVAAVKGRGSGTKRSPAKAIGVGAVLLVVALAATRWLTRGGPPATNPGPVPPFPATLNGSPPPPPPAGPDTTVPAAIADSLRQLEELADVTTMTPARARQAIALYQQIEPSLTTATAKVAGAYHAAAAYSVLKQDSKGCTLLKANAELAATVPKFAADFQTALLVACQ